MSSKLLITGGTGTLGRAYLAYGDHQGRTIVLSRDEQKQHELRELDLPDLRFILGDIRDPAKLRMAFRGVDTIIHAAALKIIPNGGYNPDEVFRTNVQGTYNVLEAAIHAGVRRVLVVSTDKAVEPTTVYGATKLLAEQLAVQMNDWSKETTIAAVRYGNVFDSRGSFTLQLKAWKPSDPPLKVTDSRCTRFWITQEKAVALIDLALARMAGGEVFVPKLGATRILDMLPLGAHYETIGLRHTEKLHETLIGAHELPHTDEFPSHFVVRRPPHRGFNTLDGPYCSGGGDGKSGIDEAPEEVPDAGGGDEPA